jgi:hypothetical protein
MERVWRDVVVAVGSNPEIGGRRKAPHIFLLEGEVQPMDP